MYTIYSNNLEKMWIIKSLLSWILSLVVAVVIFCVAIMLIPMETQTTEKIELTYVFVDIDNNGETYEIMKNWLAHGAADDWSFLFEEDSEENVDEIKDDDTSYIDSKDYILDDNNLEEILEDNLDWDLEEIEDIIIEQDDNIFQEQLDEIKDDCITPWNNVLKDGEYVLAYQQRADVPTICNVQKRSCNDWVLKWTYQQASCSEDVKYEYTRVKIISFNDQKQWELIQNPWYGKNDSATFNTDGKINQKDNNPNSSRNNSHNQPTSSDAKTNLTHKNYYNCTSPWGEIVGHGQFIKAYTSPLGFVDQKCQVELRLCLDWVLKWQSSYKNCEYKDVTYLDYIWWNDDITEVTPEEMLDWLVEDDEGGFFNWVWNLFD